MKVESRLCLVLKYMLHSPLRRPPRLPATLGQHFSLQKSVTLSLPCPSMAAATLLKKRVRTRLSFRGTRAWSLNTSALDAGTPQSPPGVQI